jgi:glycosyltransferase involved in cell wall biosynthesis
MGDKSNFEIAFASRLEQDKNPMLFLEAAKIISKEFQYVKFHILGEGSLAYEIEKFIDVNNLSNIVNFQFHRNPPEIFKNTSVFVSLQSGTNYPSQSILEAMACGNAIVASNTGDTHLFINNNNGILINLSVQEICAALRNLITNKEKTHALGKAARTFAVNNHTIERFTDYYLNLISKVYSKEINKTKSSAITSMRGNND